MQRPRRCLCVASQGSQEFSQNLLLLLLALALRPFPRLAFTAFRPRLVIHRTNGFTIWILVLVPMAELAALRTRRLFLEF